MKRLVCTILVIAVVITCGVGAWWGFGQVFTEFDEWYAQVDSDRLSEAGENANGFDYHYDLPAANASGEVEEIGFDTSRELREGAYLKLETLALRGVVKWEEVSWDEIPEAAQEQIGD